MTRQINQYMLGGLMQLAILFPGSVGHAQQQWGLLYPDGSVRNRDGITIEAPSHKRLLQYKQTMPLNPYSINLGAAKEALENPSHPRENTLVIAGTDWAHGQQAARIQ